MVKRFGMKIERQEAAPLFQQIFQRSFTGRKIETGIAKLRLDNQTPVIFITAGQQEGMKEFLRDNLRSPKNEIEMESYDFQQQPASMQLLEMVMQKDVVSQGEVEVKISQTRLKDTDFSNIIELISKNSSIRSFNLIDSEVVSWIGVVDLQEILSESYLTDLNFSNSRLPESQIIRLAEALPKNRYLTSLTLNDNLSDRAVGALCRGFKNNRNLNYVELGGLDSKAIASLINFITYETHNSSIHSLKVSATCFNQNPSSRVEFAEAAYVANEVRSKLGLGKISFECGNFDLEQVKFTQQDMQKMQERAIMITESLTPNEQLSLSKRQKLDGNEGQQKQYQ